MSSCDSVSWLLNCSGSENGWSPNCLVGKKTGSQIVLVAKVPGS